MNDGLKVEVIRINAQWKIRLMVVPQVWSTIAQYRRKRDAVVVARFYCNLRAKQQHAGDTVELIIKNYWGRIAEKNTYGYDPEESEG